MRVFGRPLGKEHPPNALSGSNVRQRRGPFVMPIKQRRLLHHWFRLVSLCLVLSVSLVGLDDFFQGQSSAYAATVAQQLVHPNAPNKYNSQAGTTSKNQPYKPAPQGNEPAHAPVPIQRNVPMPMQDQDVDLQAGKATTVLGNDGRLELDVPANAVTASDVAQAGGKLRLHVTQTAPGSGSNAGGSGHFSLGTYLIQLVDAHGKLMSTGLHQPVTAKYHYSKYEKYLDLEHAYVIVNGSAVKGSYVSDGPRRPFDQQFQGQRRSFLPSGGKSGNQPGEVPDTAQGPSVDQNSDNAQVEATSLDLNENVLSASPMLSDPSTSMTFGGDASIGYFGKPDPFNVDTSAGSLSAQYAIDVPAGPGGLTPPVNLSYSSEAVNGQHSPTGAVGWAGEGWNLSMGVINWSEHNVTAGCPSTCSTTWENSWQLSDPYGTSSELIPPNIDVSTFYDDTPYNYCGMNVTPTHPCPIQWHTANETFAKIYSYVGPVSIGQPIYPPCFRVWLTNGIMEEFGCTSDSIQYYYVAGVGAMVPAWYLDLITDPQGNQIHFTYQQDIEPWTSPITHNTYNYPRDVQLSTIEYDSPNCHDAQNMCTGANWNPLMRVNFLAGHNISRRTGSAPSGCNTGTNLRCDDPFDLSGSGGVAAPLIQSTFVLNDVQVQVRPSASSSWNTLRDYQMSYEQSAPTSIVDPVTGKNSSVAGMFDLTQMQEVGTTGATALMYSGNANSSSSAYAYMKVFDLSSQSPTIGPNTTLSYWVYPQSNASSGSVSGSNSTCVAIDMIFTDGSDLRDSGAVDQNGNQLHPAHQCGHLTLDQWNYVTSNIGASVNGKSINRIDVGYDQPGNTGGFRGYIDDISVSNPNSTTPLFATDFESGSPQPTWTNTVDNNGGGNINNVGGFCCGLTGPEMGTRQEKGNADSVAQPVRIFGYTSQTNYYEDSVYHPNPTTNCGPSWNTGNGSGCILWSQGYANGNRFLSSVSNGMGLAQTFSWANARNNTHGVPGGGSNNADPWYCNSHQSGYPCNEADDSGWSHIVLSSESSTTLRLTQNGQGGQQSSTPVTNTTSYTYQLTYPIIGQFCSDCVAGMYWGNRNDADYLGYYNAKFMGFAQATVSLPDGAKEVHKYYGTEGWGIYDASQVTCYATNPTCAVTPWWDLTNAAHGHEYEAFYYDTDGTTLLKHETNTYQAVCPPSGVSGTPASSSWGNWDGHLVSALDHNNPVAVCDVQMTQSVNETKDGSGNSVSTTTTPTYDNYGRVTQEVITSNGGTPSQVVHKTGYVWNDNVTATQTGATGTYIIETPAFSATEDGSGNRTSCSYESYDGQGYATGQSSSLTLGEATTHDAYTNCGTAANNYTPSGQIHTTSTYDIYGNHLATTDADANAGISGHQGCTIGSAQYTDCSTYDTTYYSLDTSSTNALNQTTSTAFSSGALNGFGLWPTSVQDSNGKATSYTYDALGRMTSLTLPGESAGKTTQSWTFTSWCSGTAAQGPCVELDETNRLDSANTSINRAFYDGEGRLVETRRPAPNGQDVVAYASYDASGHMTFESNSYYVAAYTGPAGPAAFSPFDTTQVGTTTGYDGLERTKTVTDPNSQVTNTAYSVVCGVPAYNDTGCYEQATIVDANSHQRATLTDAFGKVIYDRRYTGNSGSNYTLYATTVYGYDPNLALISIKHPDNQTTTTFSFDTAGRKIGQSDPDRGTETYSYDPNGNLTQSVDARGAAGTVYAGYDGLDRLLWRNTTNSPTGATVSYTYDSTANGNVGIGRKTGETFTGSGGLSGSYSYTYDQRGQETAITTTVNGNNYTLQKGYDDAGHILSETYPTGEVVNVSYNQGWLYQVSTNNQGTATTLANAIHYDGSAGAAAHITNMLVGGGMYTYNAAYDANQRLTSASMSLTSSGATLFQTQPSYDGVGNVTSVQTTLPAGTDNQKFCYDEQNRLTWAGATGTPGCGGTLTAGTLTAAQYQQSYSYDILGRMTTGPAGNSTYGDSSHLHAATSTSTGYGASYDAAGNMICRAPTSATTCSGTPTGQQMTYNAAGILDSWQDQPTPTKTVNYLYDGEGTRVALQVSNGGTTTTTAYIDDIEEVQTGGSTSTTTFYYAGSMRIAQAVNGVFTYLANDRLGSPVAVFNANGVAVAQQLYGPYGATRYSSGAMPTDIGFTGQHADAITGLDYYESRYYDPTVGQFTSADTALPESGYNPWGLSRYAYVQGNPETLTDPDGHCWPLCTMIIGAVVGAAIGAGISIATQAASGHGVNWHTVAKEAAVGAVSGAVSGLAGPGAGLLVHAAVGAASGAAGQITSNLLNHKPLGEGVLTAAVVGGVLGVASEGASRLVSKFGSRFTGSFANKAKSFFNKAESSCGLSFSADTPVATPNGEKPISTVGPGDQVQAYDPATKKVSTQTVQTVFINHDNDLIDVTLAVATQASTGKDAGNNDKQQSADVASHGDQAPPSTSQETIHTTQKHPWLTTRGWITAGELQVGDQVQQLDGTTATVVALQIMPGVQDMYDLSVNSVHTFAVGKLAVVVHNCAAKAKNDFFERFGSEEEAKAAQASRQLSQRPGHRGPDGGLKWLSLPGKASPKSLGQKAATHAWKMEIETRPGTQSWLKSIGVFKPNEPHFIGIPNAHLADFNRRIINIRIFRVR